VLPLLAFALALADAPQDSHTARQAAVSEASLKRIQRALATSSPTVLRLEPPTPTFKMEIRQRMYYTDLPPTWEYVKAGGVPFRAPGAGPIGSSPLIQIDLMPIVRAVRKLAKP
jgi:hypothetical protein